MERKKVNKPFAIGMTAMILIIVAAIIFAIVWSAYHPYVPEGGKGSEGLSYTLTDDGAGYKVSAGDCTDADVIVMSEYDGKKVTEVAYGAFKDMTDLKSVTLPANVEKIGASAFEGCSSLKSADITASGIKEIGENAFKGTALESIVIPGWVTKIGDGAFDGCSSLTEIKFGGTKAEWEAVDKGGNSFDGIVVTYSIKK